VTDLELPRPRGREDFFLIVTYFLEEPVKRAFASKPERTLFQKTVMSENLAVLYREVLIRPPPVFPYGSGNLCTRNVVFLGARPPPIIILASKN